MFLCGEKGLRIHIRYEAYSQFSSLYLKTIQNNNEMKWNIDGY